MKERRGHRLTRCGLHALILAIMAGCAPAQFRAHPQLQEKVKPIRTVAIMPPSIKIYQLAVGGTTQLMDEPPEPAKQLVATAIAEELARHADIVFKPFPSPSAVLPTSSDLSAAEIRAELEDTQALFEAVSASVLVHTYQGDPDQTFPEKLKSFDYSLGPDVQRLGRLANADALLFISGVDHISTGGRRGMLVVEALLLSPLILLNPLGPVGYAGYMTSRAGKAILSVALVDTTTGALLWYNVRQGGYSLTKPESVTGLTEWLFEGFPGNWKVREGNDRSGSPGLGGALR